MGDITKNREGSARGEGQISTAGGAGATARERIFGACDSIARDQKRVTEAAVLGMVGGRSSTVHRYVSEWKGLAELRNQAPSVPSTFLEGIQKLFDELVADAKASGRAREDELEEELEGLREQVGQLNTEIDQHGTESRQLNDTIQGLTLKVAELEVQRDTLQADLRTAEAYKGTLEQQLADEEARAKQIERDARAQADQLRKAHADELQRLSDVYTRNEDRLYQDIAQMRDDLKSKDQAMEDKLSEQRADLAQECERKVSELQKGHAAELDRLNDRLDELVGERKTLDRERREEVKNLISEHRKETSKLMAIVETVAGSTGISADRLINDDGAMGELRDSLFQSKDAK